VARPSSLVAVRPSTGEVLAVANGPEGGGENLAFVGRYPPGLTFKIVSAAAFLDAGLTPGTGVTCPRTVTVDGRTFRNAGGAALGRTTLRGAVAASCNTTFVQLAADLDSGAVADAAAAFGFDTSWQPGVRAFTGRVPAPRDAVERAAGAIGQGRVLASPLSMASVVAAVADGTWRTPVVLPDHATRAADRPRLPGGVLDDLRRMLRATVTDGTGRSLSDVPGRPVIGKTGTAEYGTGDPPATHAWVVAAQGDLAVAVIVEDGGSGRRVAAPVAARFLRRVEDGR
jgi:cell division protein FtsI/penicillin-binding protein 2